jgi:biopolymer transport protein ExbB/TolQ
MLKIEVILGIAASVVTLCAFFFRAWANLRRGRRIQSYRRSIGEQADLELERLRADLDEAEWQAAERRSRKDSSRP